ncbi:MAG: TPM domain-containing protein [Verrucomicrobiota bacterium]
MKNWLHRLFPPKINRARVLHAISQAESKTSGEIRVVLVHHKVDDPIAEAVKEFQKLGMEKTVHRNGVLILLAPKSRRFAVIGDKNVNELCGLVFWQEIVKSMKEAFRTREFTRGLEEGISRIGALLAQHFPPEKKNDNELPNDIVDRL